MPRESSARARIPRRQDVDWRAQGLQHISRRCSFAAPPQRGSVTRLRRARAQRGLAGGKAVVDGKRKRSAAVAVPQRKRGDEARRGAQERSDAGAVCRAAALILAVEQRLRNMLVAETASQSSADRLFSSTSSSGAPSCTSCSTRGRSFCCAARFSCVEPRRMPCSSRFAARAARSSAAQPCRSMLRASQPLAEHAVGRRAAEGRRRGRGRG